MVRQVGERQLRVDHVGKGKKNATEGEVSIVDILKTVSWREVLDVLLGIRSILCFLIGLVFAFWV